MAVSLKDIFLREYYVERGTTCLVLRVVFFDSFFVRAALTYLLRVTFQTGYRRK